VIPESSDDIDIASLIPHTGAMCLLDRVVWWNDTRIHCSTGSHREPGNPLAVAGQLDTVCGVEYAAQAMALHGALTAPVRGRSMKGYLASLRDLNCDDGRLDVLEADLDVTAMRLHSEGGRVIYDFAVHCLGRALLTGRAAVVLEMKELGGIRE
jgi:predicted hotdog family 3-hydroxylacyl-ACP dehydratase